MRQYFKNLLRAILGIELYIKEDVIIDLPDFPLEIRGIREIIRIPNLNNVSRDALDNILALTHSDWISNQHTRESIARCICRGIKYQNMSQYYIDCLQNNSFVDEIMLIEEEPIKGEYIVSSKKSS